MTGPRISEPITAPGQRHRIGFAELLGVVMVLSALTGLAIEMYGHGHKSGTPIEPWRLWVLFGLALAGMYFVTPRRTSELVALVGAYIPRRGGDRPADALAPRNSVPVEAVRKEQPEPTGPPAGGAG